MSSLHPNRAVWWAIVVLYFAAVLVSVHWTSPKLETQPLTKAELLEEQNRRAERRAAIDGEIERVGNEPLTPIQEARRKVRLEGDPLLNAPLRTERDVWVDQFAPTISLDRLLPLLLIGGALGALRFERKGPLSP